MSKSTYIPGDPWVICDLSGKQIRMSRSVKTWDGLRVDPEWWYPKHPQLSVRAVPDDMHVPDARPRPTEQFIGLNYGMGLIELQAPNGTIYDLNILDDGILRETIGVWVLYVPEVIINGFLLSVENDGTLVVTTTTAPGVVAWIMTSPNGTTYTLTLSADAMVVGTL